MCVAGRMWLAVEATGMQGQGLVPWFNLLRELLLVLVGRFATTSASEFYRFAVVETVDINSIFDTSQLHKLMVFTDWNPLQTAHFQTKQKMLITFRFQHQPSTLWKATQTRICLNFGHSLECCPHHSGQGRNTAHHAKLVEVLLDFGSHTHKNGVHYMSP